MAIGIAALIARIPAPGGSGTSVPVLKKKVPQGGLGGVAVGTGKIPEAGHGNVPGPIKKKGLLGKIVGLFKHHGHHGFFPNWLK